MQTLPVWVLMEDSEGGATRTRPYLQDAGQSHLDTAQHRVRPYCSVEIWNHGFTPIPSPQLLGKSTPLHPNHALLTARASPEARGQPAVASMSCNFCVCFNWLSDGFSCVAPTVLLVHSSTSLQVVREGAFLVVAVVHLRLDVQGRLGGPGSGPGTRLLVEDPGEHTQARVGDTTHQHHWPAAVI